MSSIFLRGGDDAALTASLDGQGQSACPTAAGPRLDQDSWCIEDRKPRRLRSQRSISCHGNFGNRDGHLNDVASRHCATQEGLDVFCLQAESDQHVFSWIVFGEEDCEKSDNIHSKSPFSSLRAWAPHGEATAAAPLTSPHSVPAGPTRDSSSRHATDLPSTGRPRTSAPGRTNNSLPRHIAASSWQQHPPSALHQSVRQRPTVVGRCSSNRSSGGGADWPTSEHVQYSLLCMAGVPCCADAASACGSDSGLLWPYDDGGCSSAVNSGAFASSVGLSFVTASAHTSCDGRGCAGAAPDEPACPDSDSCHCSWCYQGPAPVGPGLEELLSWPLTPAGGAAAGCEERGASGAPRGLELLWAQPGELAARMQTWHSLPL